MMNLKRIKGLMLGLLMLPLAVASGATYTNDIAPGTTVDLTSANGVADGGTIMLQYRGPLDVLMQTGGSAEWLTISSSSSSGTRTLGIVGSTVRLSVPASATASTAVAASISTGAPVGGAGGAPVTVQENDGLLVTPAAVNSAAVIFTQETTGYRTVNVQSVSPGTGNSFVFEESNDQAIWTSVSGQTLGNTGVSSPITSVSATSYAAGTILQFPTSAKYFRVRVSTFATGPVQVNALFRSEPFSRMGTFLAQTGASSVNVQGTTAQAGTVVGAPILQGVRALSAAALVSNGQASFIPGTLYGVPTQKPYSIPELDWSYVAPSGGLANSASVVVVKAAGGAGLRNYITSLNIATDTMGAACDLVIIDGSTPIYRQRIQTTGIPGGIDIDLPTPLKSTANTALGIVTQVAGTATAVTGGIYVNAQGYVAP